jgi:uncharacterized membrane protein
MLTRRPSLLLIVLLGLISYSAAFSPPSPSTSKLKLGLLAPSRRGGVVNDPQRGFSSRLLAQQQQQQQEDSNGGTIWLPQLRQVMGSVATLGALETGYLTYQKVLGDSTVLCGLDGGGGAASCNQVLNGPYSYVPFTDIPLSAMGLLAYLTVAGLALVPLLTTTTEDDTDDTANRVALTALTTAMGTFSIFLMILLFGVLQTTCPFCVFSAACSILLAMMAWIGGCLPEDSKIGGAKTTAGTSFLFTTMTAVLLFASGFNDDTTSSDAARMAMSRTFLPGTTTTLMASGADTSSTTKRYSAPAIETESSTRAVALAEKLQGLDAKMYGAYWCSHCIDQKELFGKQAFSKIQYVECSKDGVNSNFPLCKANDVPGYPSWQIQGKLYPGEQELDELEDLVQSIIVQKTSSSK